MLLTRVPVFSHHSSEVGIADCFFISDLPYDPEPWKSAAKWTYILPPSDVAARRRKLHCCQLIVLSRPQPVARLREYTVVLHTITYWTSRVLEGGRISELEMTLKKEVAAGSPRCICKLWHSVR